MSASLPGDHSVPRHPATRTSVPFPAVVAILGGGQLARMTIEAGSRMGIDFAILEREPGSPAARTAARALSGAWTDQVSLLELSQGALAVTLENEFVDAPALEWLAAQGVGVFPSGRTLGLIQDKLAQKRFMREAGVSVPDFEPVAGEDDLTAFARSAGWPLVLKARRNGYDGYGNATLRAPTDIHDAFTRLGFPERELLVEAWVPFTRELAVMVARGAGGQCIVYPVVETVQRQHICHIVRAPADTPAPVARQATAIARQAVEAIDGIGVFGVELFETADGRVLFNEIAPRPHNSGHYTIEGCVTSQFENHLRAVLGLPLGSAEMVAPAAVMVNLLGQGNGPAVVEGLDQALAVPGVSIHIYGKTQSRAGRKMGHVTALGSSVAQAEARARAAADALFL